MIILICINWLKDVDLLVFLMLFINKLNFYGFYNLVIVFWNKIVRNDVIFRFVKIKKICLN